MAQIISGVWSVSQHQGCNFRGHNKEYVIWGVSTCGPLSNGNYHVYFPETNIEEQRQ